ncbi:MAG TPA: DNA polymerase III subunit [Verrucomicrobiae bacterium]|nr:DNA polymerase III subunit [Verrucomicrobiae bacterium]
MAFADFPEQGHVVELLQRSLARGRLAHAYLFTGGELAELEAVARTLAKALNCENPPRRSESGLPLESCDACLNCRKIDEDNHADVRWVRPESKSRIVTIDQMRDLMQAVNLKATAAEYKFAVIVAADRMTEQAANAFLKTLEEPPKKTIFVLLSTEPGRLLDTILSRCLRLNFLGEGGTSPEAKAAIQWLAGFAEMTAAEKGSVLGRYRLLSHLLEQLTKTKEEVEKALSARSPLERHEDADTKLRERWEDELNAAVEAEYRRRRGELILQLQWWLRDVWQENLGVAAEKRRFPAMASATKAVAGRLTRDQALANLGALDKTQRQLHTNAQEALVLEVGLLKLKL